mgnify:FL=1
MVISGSDAANRAGAAEVAEQTITCFLRTVPAAVGGIAFLSGGQGDEEASVNLDAINRSPLDRPWEMSFSYGRGLQAAPLAHWGQDTSDVAGTQAVFAKRAKIIAAARRGEYTADME